MSAQTHSGVTPEAVRERSAARGEPDWLLETRVAAAGAVDELDAPDVIQTPGRQWTDLDELELRSIADPRDQPAETVREAVDAPDAVSVLPFADALDEHGDRLEDAFGSVVDPQTNRLTALATALFQRGTVVVVPDRVDAGTVTVRTTMTGDSLFEYTLVLAGESSSVTVLEDRQSGADAGGASASEERYYSGITEVVAGENASVRYGALQRFDRSTYNYTVKRADATTYANVGFVEGNLGSRLTKTTVATELTGDGAETRIVGAFFGEDDQHFDLDSKVWHRAENTTADLVTRGVIDDEARSVYEGVQDVGRDAWSTSSYQRENTLMLSDTAEADASPKLIINNHDTEASHSATVGQIDREDLFYMTSRGVDGRRARNMLVEGFFVPVLEEIDIGELRESFQSDVRDRLWG